MARINVSFLEDKRENKRQADHSYFARKEKREVLHEYKPPCHCCPHGEKGQRIASVGCLYTYTAGG